MFPQCVQCQRGTINMESQPVKYTSGNILTADVEALVNTVNCVGVMGRGIALQFKQAYPTNFKEYEKACKSGDVEPGKMFVHHTGAFTNPQYIINFPTKRHWRGNSRMEDIETGLVDLVATIRNLSIRSIAIPPLGSGLGQLNWSDVKATIELALRDLNDVDVVLYEPVADIAALGTVATTQPPAMTLGRALVICLIERYTQAVLDPVITLLEIHKLLYFMQESGEDLKLRFGKAPAGPFANNLRHLLLKMEGYYITGYDGGSDKPGKEIELVPGAVKDALVALASTPETNQNLQKVLRLVDGWESPFGLELLATVHWIASRDNGSTLQQIIEQTYAWDDRKRKFSYRQIELAYNSLAENRWINMNRAKDYFDSPGTKLTTSK